jgi:hypothetical protein
MNFVIIRIDLFTTGGNRGNITDQRQSAPVAIDNRHQFPLPDLKATEISHLLRNRYALQHSPGR